MATILDCCSLAASPFAAAPLGPEDGEALRAQWAQVTVATSALYATVFVGLATLILAGVAILVPYLQRQEDRRREDAERRRVAIEALKATVMAAKSICDAAKIALEADKAVGAGQRPVESRRPPQDALSWAGESLSYYLGREIDDLGIVQGLTAARYEVHRTVRLISDLKDTDRTSVEGRRHRELLRRMINDGALLARLAQAQGERFGLDTEASLAADKAAMAEAMLGALGASTSSGD